MMMMMMMMRGKKSFMFKDMKEKPKNPKSHYTKELKRLHFIFFINSFIYF